MSNNVGGSSMQISEHLRRYNPEDKMTPKKWLVILFPWLGAKKTSIQKYCDLYLQRGASVITVASTAKHFLWPKNATYLSDELLNYLLTQENELENIVIHSMSIGAFIYTVFFMELQSDSLKYQSIVTKLKGQIFDSIVIGGLSNMGHGIADNVTKNPVGHLSVRALVAAYLSATKKHTIDYFNYSVGHYHNKPMQIPTHFFYCLNDTMASPSGMDDVISMWRSKEMSVSYKCWPESKHAANLQCHKQEYLSELDFFLTKIGLNDSNNFTSLKANI